MGFGEVGLGGDFVGRGAGGGGDGAAAGSGEDMAELVGRVAYLVQVGDEAEEGG